jgi:hypothetical protein
MTDKIPTFEWNSEEDGKKEFHLFDAALQANLVTRQCRFVLDHTACPSGYGYSSVYSTSTLDGSVPCAVHSTFAVLVP